MIYSVYWIIKIAKLFSILCIGEVLFHGRALLAPIHFIKVPQSIARFPALVTVLELTVATVNPVIGSGLGLSLLIKGYC